MEIYLDNSATTQCSQRAITVMTELLQKDYGNPSSLHRKGAVAEQEIKEAAVKIARTLKAQDKEILFTSGGTESNNLAIIGCARANQRAGRHLITTSVEHASVLAPMAYLQENGFEVTYLPVDQEGRVPLTALANAIRPDTILVSLMHVNNEIGTVEPVEEAGRLIKSRKPDILFHVDAIQAYGKFRIYPQKWGIDLLSVSGHKIHAPKGTGFLYTRDKTKIRPILFGGGQQKGMRSGTENVPGAVALGVAAEEIYSDFEENNEKMYALREYFIGELLKIDGVSVNGRFDRLSAPHIVSASIRGVRAEVMLHSLEEHGIYVSSGSACSTHKAGSSATLKGIGLPQELLDKTIRFSFSIHTTREELQTTVGVLKEIIPRLQKYTRR